MFLIKFLTRQREMIAGLPLALATDYNPGFYSIRYEFVVTACKMKMTPEETINAATINGHTFMKFLKLTEASQLARSKS
jgi:imidazolonepropionase